MVNRDDVTARWRHVGPRAKGNCKVDNHPDSHLRTRPASRRLPDDFHPAMLAKVGALFVVVVLLAGVTFFAGHDRDAARAAKTLSGAPDLPVADLAVPAPVASEFGPVFGTLTLELARGDLVDGVPGTVFGGRSGSLVANAATADMQDPLRKPVRR
jgi:hypothetical protein